MGKLLIETKPIIPKWSIFPSILHYKLCVLCIVHSGGNTIECVVNDVKMSVSESLVLFLLKIYPYSNE